MIKIEVKIGGNAYKLPDTVSEKKNPLLRLKYKVIAKFFKPVEEAYPNDEIVINWDDDKKELLYSSSSIKQEQIMKILTARHLS